MNHLDPQPTTSRRERARRRLRRALALAGAAGMVVLLSCGGGNVTSTSSGGGEGVPGTRPERLSLLLEQLADRVVLPRYAAMTKAFEQLDATTVSFCASPGAAGLEATRVAWRVGIEAWLEASVMQFGPIRDDNRNLRIQFWPDANNNVPRAVQQMLARTDELTAQTLAQQSVAAQGLPALEQLLFADDDVLAQFTTGERAARRCAFATAITGNLVVIAVEVETGWRDGGFRDQLARAGRGSDAFASREAAIEEVVNNMVASVEVTKNNRIADPLGGDSITDAKPFRAESFLSANSLANVLAAIRGLQAAYDADAAFGFDDYLDALGSVTLAAQIETELRAVERLVDAIPGPLAQAVQDESLRPHVVELLDRATVLTRLVKNQLSAAMQVTVGFNENDGD